MKRVFLFIAVNILILITISITLNVLGIRPYLTANGIDYSALLMFCAVVGFMGAFISLALSRWMAKTMMGVQVIDPNGRLNPEERQLYQVVQRLSQKASLPSMPEVGFYKSPEVNAFATGPSKSRSLVAVSTGLLERMDQKAIEGVLSHEVAHIANGDMVTMTLVQGVVNTFVMFFARIAAWAVSQAMSGDRDSDDGGHVNPLVHFVAVIAFEILFSLLGSIVVAYFSRIREFKADRGGADLAGQSTMVHALESLKGTLELVDTSHQSVASLKISNRPSGFWALFSTHPDLDLRIERLKNAYVSDMLTHNA